MGLLGIGFCESPASFLVGIKTDHWIGNLRLVSNAGLALPCRGVLVSLQPLQFVNKAFAGVSVSWHYLIWSRR